MEERRCARAGRLLAVLVAVSAVAAAAPAASRAAQLIGRDASTLSLQADAKGEALVTFTSEGKRQHVLVWGAIDALPNDSGKPQVRFQVDYSGGWGKYRHELFGGKVYWQVFSNGCRRYTGPSLPYLVAACDAPDGSYWAVQQWPEPLPDLGFTPWTAAQRQVWLEVSHWTGPIAKLTAYADWVYGGYHHLFGNYSYRGQPVFGFHTTRYGVPTDGYGRLVFLDTLDSSYGSGWRRENSFVTHGPSGAWCYGFFQHDPTTGGYQHPPGQTAMRGPGDGTQYRLLAEGPGVTPDVAATVADPGDWDATDPAKVAFLEQELALLPTVVGADPKCKLGHDIGLDVAPQSTAAPQLSSLSPAVGDTLDVSAGAWLGAPTTFRYVWFRCGGSGNDCRPIPGAEGASYTVTSADVGSSLYAVVTAGNGHGNRSATTANRTAVVGSG